MRYKTRRLQDYNAIGLRYTTSAAHRLVRRDISMHNPTPHCRSTVRPFLRTAAAGRLALLCGRFCGPSLPPLGVRWTRRWFPRRPSLYIYILDLGGWQMRAWGLVRGWIQVSKPYGRSSVCKLPVCCSQTAPYPFAVNIGGLFLVLGTYLHLIPHTLAFHTFTLA